ncbi:type II toxin-antitoxin system RelE/ParE family toxin [Polynucleobacter sp. JS-Mosq-20-D10]|uniref:type II toxin-antitoxin system RelE/ParE family toxin n=1 Tax=Polynucleobacter sp. JS-Mosq-20-D10 TaxID=2576922 RepID=UPI001BFE5274|nr:type II toxin-antitoxin system RelE/ParE family toxin [Polynucleobacter sp. JS-Mosq-20-D10]QWE00739.1 type II toxin-antitoxin system RelE/ParE family toxin [Polynucleobacter sp. JS-Mosq-20-D10]
MTEKRAFKTKNFNKWMRKTDLKDQDLLVAVAEMEAGLVGVDLGGNVFKKRIALPGAGKRAGARTLVASKSSKKWFFLYGFAKNEKDNINDDELVHLQGAANRLMNLTDQDIEKVILIGELKELTNNA